MPDITPAIPDQFLQRRELADFLANGSTEWTQLWCKRIGKDHASPWYLTSCALSEPSSRANVLKSDSWDTDSTHLPAIWKKLSTGKYFYENPATKKVSPLIWERSFIGHKPIVELSEQFRLYHNLLETEPGNFNTVSDTGQLSPAAAVTASEVLVRTDLLKKYLAARQLDLLLYIDSRVFVKEGLELEKQTLDYSVTDSRIFIRLGMSSLDSQMAVSRLLGKIVVRPLSIESAVED